MARRVAVPGWTRLNENQFKAALTAAARTEPGLCQRLRRAVQIAAARRGVLPELRDRYLRWISEVEAAIAAMAEAEKPTTPESRILSPVEA